VKSVKDRERERERERLGDEGLGGKGTKFNIKCVLETFKQLTKRNNSTSIVKTKSHSFAPTVTIVFVHLPSCSCHALPRDTYLVVEHASLARGSVWHFNLVTQPQKTVSSCQRHGLLLCTQLLRQTLKSCFVRFRL